MEEAIRMPNVSTLNKMFAHHCLYVENEMDKLGRYSLYDKSTNTYFGSFTAEFETSDNVVYVLTYTPVGISQTDTTDNPDELVYMISEFNKTRIAPPQCYNTGSSAWIRQYDTFSWYLGRRGFNIEETMVADRRAVYVNGDTKMTIYIIGGTDEFSGEIWKDPAAGEQLVKTRYFDVESLISVLQSITVGIPVVERKNKENKSKKDLLKRLINELIDKLL